MVNINLRSLAVAILLTQSTTVTAQSEPPMNPRPAEQLDVPVQVVTDTVTYPARPINFICPLEDQGVFFGASDPAFNIELGCSEAYPSNGWVYNHRNGRVPVTFSAINFVEGDLTHIQMWVGPLKTGVDGRLRFSLNTTRDFSDYSGYPEYAGYDFQIRAVSQSDTLTIYTRDLHTNGQPQWQSFVATLPPGEYRLLLDDWDPRATDWSTTLDLDELYAQRAHFHVATHDQPAEDDLMLQTWPNPVVAGNSLNLEGLGPVDEWVMRDALGRRVAVGHGSSRVPTRGLLPGVYVVALRDDPSRYARFTVVR